MSNKKKAEEKKQEPTTDNGQAELNAKLVATLETQGKQLAAQAKAIAALTKAVGELNAPPRDKSLDTVITNR